MTDIIIKKSPISGREILECVFELYEYCDEYSSMDVESQILPAIACLIGKLAGLLPDTSIEDFFKIFNIKERN